MNTTKVIELIKAASESDAKNVARYVQLSKELGLLYKSPEGQVIVSGEACYSLLDTIYTDEDVDNIALYSEVASRLGDNFPVMKENWQTSKKLAKELMGDLNIPLTKELITSGGMLAGISAINYPVELFMEEVEEQFSI